MSKLKSMLAMAMVSAMAAESGVMYRAYLNIEPDPEWTRKKCKSCASFKRGYGVCSRPLDRACKYYQKRKK